MFLGFSLKNIMVSRIFVTLDSEKRLPPTLTLHNRERFGRCLREESSMHFHPHDTSNTDSAYSSAKFQPTRLSAGVCLLELFRLQS